MLLPLAANSPDDSWLSGMLGTNADSRIGGGQLTCEAEQKQKGIADVFV